MVSDGMRPNLRKRRILVRHISLGYFHACRIRKISSFCLEGRLRSWFLMVTRYSKPAIGAPSRKDGEVYPLFTKAWRAGVSKKFRPV